MGIMNSLIMTKDLVDLLFGREKIRPKKALMNTLIDQKPFSFQFRLIKITTATPLSRT